MTRSPIPLLMASLLAAAPALAQELAINTREPARQARDFSIQLEQPGSQSLGMPEEGMVIITGTISKVVGPYSYQLQYGSDADDVISVDAKRAPGITANAYKVGDRVNVTGRIDDRLFMRHEVDALDIQPEPQATGGIRS